MCHFTAGTFFCLHTAGTFFVCADTCFCLRRQKEVPARGRPGRRPARSGRSDQRECVEIRIKQCKIGFWPRRGRPAPGLPMAHAPCAMVWPGPCICLRRQKQGSPGIDLIFWPGGRHADSPLRDTLNVQLYRGDLFCLHTAGTFLSAKLLFDCADKNVSYPPCRANGSIANHRFRLCGHAPKHCFTNGYI